MPCAMWAANAPRTWLASEFDRMRDAGIAANAFHLDLISIAYNLRTAAVIR